MTESPRHFADIHATCCVSDLHWELCQSNRWQLCIFSWTSEDVRCSRHTCDDLSQVWLAAVAQVVAPSCAWSGGAHMDSSRS